jgi:hypothetical protein
MNPWTVMVMHPLQHTQFAAGWVDAGLKSFVLLSAAGGLSLCWRRSAASARHWIWFLAVAGSLVLPGLSSLLPPWQRPLWTVGTHTDAKNELTLTLTLAPERATADAASPVAAAISAPGLVSTAGGRRISPSARPTPFAQPARKRSIAMSIC